MRLQVTEYQVRHRLTSLVCPAPHVRHQDDVVKVKERFRDIGLILKHVKACPAEAPLDERRDELRLIDMRATPDVYEHALGTQRIDHLTVDNVAGLLIQWASHHEDIAVCCQFNHTRVIGVIGVFFLCSLVVVDWAIKGLHPCGNSKPYPAQPNDAHSFATELQKYRDNIYEKLSKKCSFMSEHGTMLQEDKKESVQNEMATLHTSTTQKSSNH
nr:uncharacterized protein LOC127339506 [Lolium perenne]